MVLLVLSPDIAAADFDKLNQKLRARYPDIQFITVDEVYQRIHRDDQKGDSSQPIILDARTAKEFAVSHIQNGQLTPDERTALNILAGKDKDTEIIIYCSLGYRSGELARKLQQAGYTNVVNMEGSLFQWVDKDYPVFSGEAEVREAHPYNLWWGRNLREDYRSYQAD